VIVTVGLELSIPTCSAMPPRQVMPSEGPDADAGESGFSTRVVDRMVSTRQAAVEAMTRPGEVVELEPAAQRPYAAMREVYADLTGFTDPLFRRVAAFGG